MKISYNWLKQYIDTQSDVEEVSHLLTGCGLEVESAEPYESVKGGLEGLFTGKVVQCEKHPNSDHLSLTKVDTGSGRLLDIVCGAPNVAAGQKVVVAVEGTTLFKEDQSFTIKKTKIRGAVSEGMICAEDEIGLGDSHEGIMILPEDTPVGIPAKDYFRIYHDTIFEIGLTPNRVDAASHTGVARDLSAILNLRAGKQVYPVKYPSVENIHPQETDGQVEIIIEDPVACPRYTGMTITGVTVAESPDWLQNYLRAIGLRPINNIVDISNYVLHETGHPTHIFDLDEIKGNKVIIKTLPEKTQFTTLDEVNRELTSGDLMICNAEKPMCIAGVFGGIESGVSAKTTRVFIESAFFNPVHIRKTSKFHGLKTDASFRFERGADPEITVYALQRVASLILDIAGGKISSSLIDVYPVKIYPKEINLRLERVNSIIGKKIEKETVVIILESLGFKLNETGENIFRVTVPTNKVDISREIDLIEEIIRIYGFNNIEIPEKISLTPDRTPKPDMEQIRNMLSDFLSSQGFHEIMNNSLTTSRYSGTFDFIDENKNVVILSPVSKDLDTMRQTLLFGGLETILYNRNRKISDLKLYEFGSIYQFNGQKDSKKTFSDHEEKSHLALFLTGNDQQENWFAPPRALGIYHLKAYIFNLFNRMNIDTGKVSFTELAGAGLSSGVQILFGTEFTGLMGEVDDDVLKHFEIRQKVYYAELDFTKLAGISSRRKIMYQELPKYPEVRRDLALLIGKDIQFSQVEKIAFETEKLLLKKVDLFDIYEGENLGKDKKSYAVSFILQDDQKTLTDEEIERVMSKLAKAFSSQIDAVIR